MTSRDIRLRAGITAETGALVLLALLATGCSQHNTGDLATARSRLRPVPCGPTPAINGAAGVNANPREVYLDDWIVLSVCHLDQLVKDAEAQQQPITLFIEGLDSGNQLTGIDRDGSTVTFILDRTPQNKGLWAPLLYDPVTARITSMHVSAGVRGSHALPVAEGANLVMRLNKLYLDWTSVAWLGFLALFLTVLLWHAARSDMLRSGRSVGGVRQAYSLGRTQMAWWFFLILAGYVFIWFVTGDNDVVSPSLLVLMGISAATAITAAAISPEGGPTPVRKRLTDEIAATDAALQQLAVDLAEAAGRPGAASEALQSMLESKRAGLESARAALIVERAGLTTVVPSDGFWKDLVSDESGSVALDRFQIVAWTCVLGGVFVYSVVCELSMPEFSATLLTLMGISSGTYIGFKLPKT